MNLTSLRLHRRLAGLLAALLLTFVMALISPRAEAFPLRGHGFIGAGAASIDVVAPTAVGWWGPSLHTGLVLDVSEFIKIVADVQSSYHFQRTIDEEIFGPHLVLATALGARYVFDVFTYVPYVGLSFVAYPVGPPSQPELGGEPFAFRATVGLDYRHNRRISFGGAIDLSAPLTQPANFPHYSSVRAHIGFHFRRF